VLGAGSQLGWLPVPCPTFGSTTAPATGCPRRNRGNGPIRAPPASGPEPGGLRHAPSSALRGTSPEEVTEASASGPRLEEPDAQNGRNDEKSRKEQKLTVLRTGRLPEKPALPALAGLSDKTDEKSRKERKRGSELTELTNGSRLSEEPGHAPGRLMRPRGLHKTAETSRKVTKRAVLTVLTKRGLFLGSPRSLETQVSEK